jgi:hypothetical protein
MPLCLPIPGRSPRPGPHSPQGAQCKAPTHLFAGHGRCRGASGDAAQGPGQGGGRGLGCSKEGLTAGSGRRAACASRLCLAQADQVERQGIAPAGRRVTEQGSENGALGSKACLGSDWLSARCPQPQALLTPCEHPRAPRPPPRPPHFSMNCCRTTRAASRSSVSPDVAPCATGPARRPSSSTSSPWGWAGGKGWRGRW